ncbi:MAG TPA: hypothetical protein VH760_01555 [Gaiellaceae bacterium]
MAYAALAGPMVQRPGRPHINSGTQQLTNSTSASFSYRTHSPVDFLCSLDSGAFTACGSGTTGSVAYAGPLADGLHTFRVEGQIGAAVSTPSTQKWTVDTQPPPPPTITGIATAGTTTRVHYSDTERRTTFQCKLDGAAYASCGSGIRYRGLAAGAHGFCVRALDRAGNASAPACTTWVVAAASVTFSISGQPLPGALLYPAAQVPLNLVFTNPNPVPITVTGVTVTVTGTSAGGCSGANFNLAHQLLATPIVPAGATKSLQQLGVAQSDWPQLRMLDVGNQDSCRNATVNLAYTGTATG